MSGGETNLTILLREARPILNAGDYVFCSINGQNMPNLDEIVCFFKESEAISLILEKNMAQKHGFETMCEFAWITLQIHSSLEAVGLTASFSAALAAQQISCNVVAGNLHDHIFVPKPDAQRAVQILENLEK